MRRPRASGPGIRAIWGCALSAALLLLLLPTSTLARASGAAKPCASGVLQLLPPTDPTSDCISSYDQPTGKAIKSICGAAFKVTVTNGIIRIVPLELGSFPYNTNPWESTLPRSPFNCKDLNASGLFNPGSTTAATLMLLDDLTIGSRLSILTKTGPSRVALTPGADYPTQAGLFNCTYNYTVVSGCVLGAVPANKTPPKGNTRCPPGHIRKTGRFGLQYCSICPPTTYSPGGAGATTCTPCPIGTVARYPGSAKCEPCNAAQGQFAPKPGRRFCDTCQQGRWTDGKTQCKPCPAGSTPSAAKPHQCVRCYAGKKCCTVNADKDCPKCTSSAKPATYTSIFALESATPSACLASNYAVCAPKLNISIDGTCTIIINNIDNGQTVEPNNVACSWRTALPIKGAAVNALNDLAQLGSSSSAVSLEAGNVTAAASPYLTVTIPTAKCTFRYRALTAPAAKLLGTAPKPAKPSTCPAGSYIDTSTDTKPGPCLPCPAGTYSTKPNTRSSCTPCAAGTYAKRLGSTSCTKCPPARASSSGAISCRVCEANMYPGPSQALADCRRCPARTAIPFAGTGVCLGKVLGSTCCAAGACSSQSQCGSKHLSAITGARFNYYSILRLKSLSLSSPSCRNATFLSCLPPKAEITIMTRSLDFSVNLRTTTVTRCTEPYRFDSLMGSIAGANRALVAITDPVWNTFFVNPDSVIYELLSDSKAGTLTMYLSPRTVSPFAEPVTPTPSIRKECSATFQLLLGDFLDLRQPPTATCPPASTAEQASGRTVCRFCGEGRFKNSTGGCEKCPVGTYQPLIGSTTCRPCPTGFDCSYPGASEPSECGSGTHAPKPRGTKCIICPAGTYSGRAAPSCKKCPKGTITPKSKFAQGFGACGVPWATKF